MTQFSVTAREGLMCKAANLSVEFNGVEAIVRCSRAELDTFWAQRLAFLRSNPNA